MMSQAARPRWGWLWAGVPVVVLLLSCFGAAGGSFVARQEFAAASPSPSPAAVRSPSPAPTVVIRLPDTLLGRAKATQKALVQSAEQAVAAQRTAESTAESVQAAYYGNANRQNLIFVLAVQARSADPRQTYARVVEAMEQQQKGLTLTEIDPGPLGGQAGCGEAPVSGSPVTFCVWVDAGSYGFVEFFGVHVGPQRAQFVRARSQIESVS
jgi:hypothetical protein